MEQAARITCQRDCQGFRSGEPSEYRQFEQHEDQPYRPCHLRQTVAARVPPRWRLFDARGVGSGDDTGIPAVHLRACNRVTSAQAAPEATTQSTDDHGDGQ